MKPLTGRQTSPPLTPSSGSNSVGSLPCIDEGATWHVHPGAPDNTPEPLGPEHYPDWFEWLNADGVYTMVDHKPPQNSPYLYPAPTVPTQTCRPDSLESIRKHRASQHRKDREALRKNKLCDTGMGRVILNLTRYAWYRMPNGLTAMQFGQGESTWRSNDCANNINWLRSGAYAHRSVPANMLAVVNIDMLAPYFAAAGYAFFSISPAPTGWPVLQPVLTHQRPPRFLYASFKSPYAKPPDAPVKCEDAGQTAHGQTPPQPD
ncbi:MAG: hypothetical protein EOO40_01940 [Deltaproteobacteria bacterium]|nr:MAG: hypothetical protein EOO40_01940 [Deltaproteobacteria bacterium]